MNLTTDLPNLISDLRGFVVICKELPSLSVEEYQTLGRADRFDIGKLCDARKNLLTRLNEVLVSIKNWRQVWQQQNRAEHIQHPEVKALLEVLQQVIVRILQLDRENQQALLRSGLLPACHLPATAAQQPGFVARLYSRRTPS